MPLSEGGESRNVSSPYIITMSRIPRRHIPSADISHDDGTRQQGLAG
jgi:hypothetical protein